MKDMKDMKDKLSRTYHVLQANRGQSYVCLICMPYMYALYVCLICMPYMYLSCSGGEPWPVRRAACIPIPPANEKEEKSKHKIHCTASSLLSPVLNNSKNMLSINMLSINMLSINMLSINMLSPVLNS